MIKIQLIRRRRLQQLVDERFGGNQSAFARAIKRSPTYVWRLLAHGDNEKGMGERLAREIERLLEMESGWLDERAQALQHAGAVPVDVAAAAVDAIAVPLVSLEEVARVGPRAATEAVRMGMVFGHRKLGSEAFGLPVTGAAMAPELVEGDRIILDPEIRPEAGDVVVAKAGDSIVLRRYRPRGIGTGYELAAVNNDYAPIWSDQVECVIIATMVEHHRYRRPSR